MRPPTAIPILCLLSLAPLACAADEGLDFFEREVRPVLAENCYSCHSERAETPFAGLRVDSREAILKGGDHGPAIEPGDPDGSRLIQAIRGATIQMPPTGRLSARQIAALARWVEMGAPWPREAPAPAAAEVARENPAWADHWSWQPLGRAAPPDVAASWAQSPIDAFVWRRLEEVGLEPGPPAGRRTLLRRLSYDLVGLPPSASEVDAFEQDPSPDATARAVDRLLGSERFGERWARYWLDLARYAETGAQNKRFPSPWTFRDWVIRAFNRDLPYDRFIELQLAADLLPLEDRRDLAALGFLTVGINLPRPTDAPENMDDRIDVVTRSFLGLTVACARCHDHKYDPIPTADYYALYGVFINSPDVLEPQRIGRAERSGEADFYTERLRVRRQAIDDFRRERLEAHKAEARSADWIERYLLAAWEGRDLTNPQLETMSRERNLDLYLLKRWRSYLNSALAENDPIFRPWAGEPSTNPYVAGAVQGAASPAELASRYAKLLPLFACEELYEDPVMEAIRQVLFGEDAPANIPFEDFWWIQTEGDSNVVKSLRWQYHGVAWDWGLQGGPDFAMAVRDRRRLEPAYIFRRGNQHDRGEPVPRRFLTVLDGPDPEPFDSGSGRLELARAIADPGNPLTSRVIVNRVWQRLFGQGLVRTVSDFGLRGAEPSHPELLDYLARTFVADGWSIKRLIRRIVQSSVYQQSSSGRSEAAAVDPENHLLWRMNRRRLDFEALRDSMLAVAGRLDPQVGGASFLLGAQPSTPRRTLYAHIEREELSPLLKTFDFSNPEAHTPERSLTTVPQQSLFLMNSDFVAEQARQTAALTAGFAVSKRIKLLYRRLFARAPTEREIRLGREFLATHEPSEAARQPSAWRYGYGAFDPLAERVNAFQSFPVFADDSWRGASLLPAPDAGYAHLTAGGGAPGNDLERAVIRRWVSPIAGEIRISGTLKHGMNPTARRFDHSNGVRGWIVSDRQGLLAMWKLRGARAVTDFDALPVEEGEILDFVVDARDDYEADGFSWSPVIEQVVEDEGAAGRRWDAAEDFRGPPAAPLDAWEAYAQVLLETNEFLFID